MKRKTRRDGWAGYRQEGGMGRGEVARKPRVKGWLALLGAVGREENVW